MTDRLILRIPRLLWFTLAVSVAAVTGAVAAVVGRTEDWS